MEYAPSQEEQIDYARALRMLKAGWTPELRRGYFSWFPRAEHFKGGASFGGFVEQIKRDALEHLTDAEKGEVKPILETKVPPSPGRPTGEPPGVRQGLDPRRAGAGRRGQPEAEARLRPGPDPVRGRPVLFVPPL